MRPNVILQALASSPRYHRLAAWLWLLYRFAMIQIGLMAHPFTPPLGLPLHLFVLVLIPAHLNHCHCPTVMLLRFQTHQYLAQYR